MSQIGQIRKLAHWLGRPKIGQRWRAQERKQSHHKSVVKVAYIRNRIVGYEFETPPTTDEDRRLREEFPFGELPIDDFRMLYRRL